MLKVTNTLTRKKEEFKPLNPPFVGMYVCGPTVYDDPHLGHAKSYVSFDVILRYLRHEGFKVRYIQNITDVGHLLGDNNEGEDRILKRARIEKLEPQEIAQKYENHYFRDMDLLNNLRPDISCRATGYIPEMIELVEVLIQKGFAYEADGNVYFEISRFPNYGKLSGRRVEDMISGTRVKVAEGKRHPADFALWKKADPEHLMQWSSPWSRGYPGWHLECSVMSQKYLGDTVDIHGGGIDNQFPHHECEIAQSEAATGKQFVKYWLHNNMVTVDGKKMSKSLGNFVNLSDLFDKYDPMAVRFFILQGHYRSPQDFSDRALDAGQKGFERLSKCILKLRSSDLSENVSASDIKKWDSHRESFVDFMNDDFNTAGAVSVLFDIVKSVNEQFENSDENKGSLVAARNLLSELAEDCLGLKIDSASDKASQNTIDAELIELVIELRQGYRQDKNWAKADLIRDRLLDLGIILEDGKEEATWKRQA